MDGGVGAEGGIVGYLASLGSESLSRLYTDRFTTSTVFRSLPPLAKTYILRIILLPKHEDIPKPLIDSWLAINHNNANQAKPAHFAALNRLVSLHVMLYSKSNNSFTLNPSFHDSLLACIQSNSVDVEASDSSAGKETASMEELERFAKNSWERLLHFIIGSSKKFDSKLPEQIVPLLENLNLIKKSVSKPGHIEITPTGYSFLFKDLHAQLWTILIGYLNYNVDTQHLNRDEVLRFMFRLGFLVIGKDYSRKGRTLSENVLIQDLCNLGLLYLKHGPTTKSKRYIVTPLAKFLSAKVGTGTGMNIDVTASTGAKEMDQDEKIEERGFIIVETSFRFYAYTNSPLQMTLIRLFVFVQAILPNLIVGKITKRSIRKAVSMGITSEEILNYLEMNIHPEMVKAGSRVPSNVCDQIRLWEDERNRMKIQPIVMLEAFGSQDEYENCKEYATSQNVLVYHKDAKMFLFVDPKNDIIENAAKWRPNALNMKTAKPVGSKGR